MSKIIFSFIDFTTFHKIRMNMVGWWIYHICNWQPIINRSRLKVEAPARGSRYVSCHLLCLGQWSMSRHLCYWSECSTVDFVEGAFSVFLSELLRPPYWKVDGLIASLWMIVKIYLSMIRCSQRLVRCSSPQLRCLVRVRGNFCWLSGRCVEQIFELGGLQQDRHLRLTEQ